MMKLTTQMIINIRSHRAISRITRCRRSIARSSARIMRVDGAMVPLILLPSCEFLGGEGLSLPHTFGEQQGDWLIFEGIEGS